jgi:hypothetical protein
MGGKERMIVKLQEKISAKISFVELRALIGG